MRDRLVSFQIDQPAWEPNKVLSVSTFLSKITLIHESDDPFQMYSVRIDREGYPVTPETWQHLQGLLEESVQ